MTRILPLLGAIAVLAGCENRALSWTYEIPAGVETPDSFLTARIREQGCGLGDLVIYEVLPRDVSGSTIPAPELGEGTTYCFEVVLENRRCEAYARSAELVTLEREHVMPAVRNVLAAQTPQTCEGGLAFCSGDRGCLRCGEQGALCPADGSGPARCCPALFDCSDNPVLCAEL